MAKFAQRCLSRFSELTKELELSLGPGTADLGIRIGLHSGPVTAGVLRGEKARFQLFGDTMNTGKSVALCPYLLFYLSSRTGCVHGGDIAQIGVAQQGLTFVTCSMSPSF